MDSTQTVDSVEILEGTPEAEDPILKEEDTAEMGELPVEDWDYQRPKRGELRTGVILSIGEQEVIVDVGAKRDGIVPNMDLQRYGAEALAALTIGDEVPVYVLRPEDQDGNLVVSLNMAKQEQAWQRANELFESGEVVEDQVIGYNKGGLVVPVGDVRGFIPASQVPGFPHGLNQEDRLKRLSEMVGETLQVKVIEINKRKRRLILSATAAQQQWRKQQRERLLEELREGEVRRGVVSSLCPFGAFVDLGGADGLVHLSELSWRRVRHPREVLNVGDEIEVYVLRLDHDRNRIGLSLKRLQPEPWALVEDKYELGQLVQGVVTNVVDFGAFAEIEDGVEGLIHVSELTDQTIQHPREVVKKGDLLLLRIIRVDVRRKRLGLSLKRVLESEWSEWAARVAVAEAAEEAEEASIEPLEELVEEPMAEAAEDDEAASADVPVDEAPEAAAEVEEVLEQELPGDEDVEEPAPAMSEEPEDDEAVSTEVPVDEALEAAAEVEEALEQELPGDEDVEEPAPAMSEELEEALPLPEPESAVAEDDESVSAEVPVDKVLEEAAEVEEAVEQELPGDEEVEVPAAAMSEESEEVLPLPEPEPAVAEDEGSAEASDTQAQEAESIEEVTEEPALVAADV